MKLVMLTKGFWALFMIVFLPLYLKAQNNQDENIVNDQKLFDISKNTDIYTQVLSNLNSYCLYDLDPNELSKKAIDAMLASIDPYTSYYTESDLQDFLYRRTGKYEGIGFTFYKSYDSSIIILDLVPNGPADKANLQIGDTIISVNGKKLKDLDADEVSTFIQNVDKNDVDLEIARCYNEGRKHIILNKSVVEKEKLGYAGWMDENVKNTAIVKLNKFSAQCSQEVEEALDSLFKINPQMKSIILDLRSNPGGLLIEAVKLVNLFVDRNKLVVYTQGRYEDDRSDYKTQHRDKFGAQNLAVLIDSHSASASEIVSGALQDYDRGVIVGQNSYGKGLVQNTRKLGYNEQMKLTIAKYYIPSGRCIQALDYAKKNSAGVATLVPESERNTFYTANKRPVKDGRGVTPDIEIPNPISEFLKEVESKNIIFAFVSQNVDVPKIASPEAVNDAFMQSKVQEFYKWIPEEDAFYGLAMLKGWKDILSDKSVLDREQKANAEKIYTESIQKQLMSEEDALSYLIKKEIMRRMLDHYKSYEYNKSSDPYLQKSAEILNNQSEYNKILAIK